MIALKRTALAAAAVALMATEAVAADPYASFNFKPQEVELDGKRINALTYQGWVGYQDSNEVFHFVRRQGPRKFWSMGSSGSGRPLVEKDPRVRSTLFLVEVDCVEGRTRPIQGAVYDGVMGFGNSLYGTRSMNAAWEYPNPDSFLEVWVNHLCKNQDRP